MLHSLLKLTAAVHLGFSIIRFATDDIPNTLDLIDASGVIDYSKLKSFAIADYAFLLSYAKVSNIPGLTLWWKCENNLS